MSRARTPARRAAPRKSAGGRRPQATAASAARTAEPAPFAARLLDWFDRHGRHDLPWQHPRTAYRVWLSEVMLQQTQVATVIPYFARFLARFPDFATLARAPLDEVLALWAGLGYYARARNLHACAIAVVERHGGEFPRDFDEALRLPGIGRSTAGAILAQAFGARHAILDGNVRRVLARHAAVAGWPGTPAVQAQLWTIAESHLPQARLADYTQALMDLGATVCRARDPDCARCPLRADCAAHARGRVGDFPAPRPKRARADRSAHVLLLENERGEILLERRPPAGIWGGLWCLPIVDLAIDWSPECEARYGLRVAASTALAPLRHSFTHFDLNLLPQRVRVVESAVLAEHAERRWTRIDAPLPVGVPAPVKRLLQAAQSNRN